MSFETENRAQESGLLPKICIITMSTHRLPINEFHLTGDSIKPGILNVYQEMMWNTGTPSVLYSQYCFWPQNARCSLLNV